MTMRSNGVVPAPVADGEVNTVALVTPPAFLTVPGVGTLDGDQHGLTLDRCVQNDFLDRDMLVLGMYTPDYVEDGAESDWAVFGAHVADAFPAIPTVHRAAFGLCDRPVRWTVRLVAHVGWAYETGGKRPHVGWYDAHVSKCCVSGAGNIRTTNVAHGTAVGVDEDCDVVRVNGWQDEYSIHTVAR